VWPGPRPGPPPVYDLLRRLATREPAREEPGQALRAMPVHEADVRTVGGDLNRAQEGRGHYLAVAAEVVRPIFSDRAGDRGWWERGRPPSGPARVRIGDPDP
jgi:ECF sigma factor